MSADWPPPDDSIKRRRIVTRDERQLWKTVNKDTVPLSQTTQIMHVEPAKAKPAPAGDSTPSLIAPQMRSFRPFTPSKTPSARFVPKPEDLSALSEATPGIDRATARSMRKGERRPDARIDLHGMTMERAHDALTAFIITARQRGHRCVLVITGKGDSFRRGQGAGERSLKRDVPRWLNLPPLSGMIVGVFEAHQRHGGAGALYVYLKKPRG